MATRTIVETDCDRCEKKNVPVKSFQIYTHSESDPAGGHSEPSGKAFDLCLACMANMIDAYIKEHERKDGNAEKLAKDFLEKWKIKRTTSW